MKWTLFRKAKLLLKKKKYFEQNLEKTDGQLDNLDSLVNNIEFTVVEHQVIVYKYFINNFILFEFFFDKGY